MKTNLIDYIFRYKILLLILFFLSLISFFLIRSYIDNRVNNVLSKNLPFFESISIVDILYNKKLIYHDIDREINILQLKLLVNEKDNQIREILDKLSYLSRYPTIETIENFKIDLKNYFSVNIEKNISENFYQGGYSEYYEDDNVNKFYTENIIIEDKFENSLVFKNYSNDIESNKNQIKSLILNFNNFIKKDNIDYIKKISSVHYELRKILTNSLIENANKYSELIEMLDLKISEINNDDDIKKLSVLLNNEENNINSFIKFINLDKELKKIDDYYENFERKINNFIKIYGNKDVASIRSIKSSDVTVAEFDRKSLKFNFYVLNFVIFLVLFILIVYIREILKK